MEPRPHLRTRIVVIAGCLLGSLLPERRAHALDVSSWIVYWDMAKGLEQAQRSGAALHDVAIFCYRFSPEGRLVPAASVMAGEIAIVRATRAEKFPVWVSVTNDLFRDGELHLKDPGMVHDRVSNSRRRAAHIQDLVGVAAGADGLEIDYENLWAKDHDDYSTFVAELAEALHTRSQKLIVVVQPKTSDQIKNEAGAIDWAAVAKSADLVKVMAYHYHYASGPPGPIAPPDWVTKLAQFALERIPKDKLAIIFTLSGFDWPAGGTAKSIDYQEAMRLAAIQGVPVKRDPVGASPYFTYTDSQVRHEVWFEDAASLRKKLTTLDRLGISHVGYWRLGAGDPAFWTGLGSRT